MNNIAFFFASEISPTSGGVERVASIMFEELSHNGYFIYTLYVNKKGYVDAIPNQHQLPSHDLTSEKNASFIADFLKANNIKCLLNFGAIFNNSSRSVVEGCKRAKVPHIAIYHNTLEMPLLTNRYTRNLIQYPFVRSLLRTMLAIVQRLPFYKGASYIYKHSSDAIVLANCYLDEYRFLINLDNSNKLHAIYNPIPLTPPSAVDYSKKKNIALFVGRLEPQKNISFLLRAWAQANISDWTLKIVGNGSELQILKNLCKSLRIEDSVSFEGHRNPIPYYEEAKLFCMTSIFEGFPMTLIECQAFGCVPIITDSYTAAPEIVKNNENGLLIKANNLSAYSQALKVLTSDNSLWERLSNKARLYSDKFDKKRIMNQWIDLLAKY